MKLRTVAIAAMLVSSALLAPSAAAVVTATATGSDPDGDVLSYTFTWKVNGLVRKTTSGPNASDRFDLGVAGNGDRGDTLVVEVVASDGTASSAPASASATVANTAPTVTVTLDDSTPKKNQHLTARAYGKDADGDALTFDFTWRVNGVVVGSSSGSSDTDSIFLKGLVGNGDTVTVTVLAHDASTASEPASASATVSPGGQGASDFTHTYAYAPNPQ